LETKAKLIVDKQNTVAKFNEVIPFSVSLYKTQKQDGFQEKQVHLTLIRMSRQKLELTQFLPQTKLK
jgi:hypothetical protein